MDLLPDPTNKGTAMPLKTTRRDAPGEIARLIDPVGKRLADNKFIRRKLPVYGRLHIDRQLPFLCLYRRTSSARESGAERFAQAFSSHLLCSAKRSLHGELSNLTRVVAQNLIKQFGTCLILEIWDGPPPLAGEVVVQAEMVPEFLVVSSRGTPVGASNYFSEALGRVKAGGNSAVVSTKRSNHCCPKRLSPLVTSALALEMGCHLLGIEISPFYLNPETGELYPYVLRRIARQFSLAANRALFSYTRNHTSHRPPHYHALGRRAIIKAVWEADRMLAGISDSLDILLNVTPVNAESSFREFQKTRFEVKPQLHYRPLPVDPISLKISLYKAPVTRIEDPALAQMFREQLEDLDRQIDMLRDRNTSRFLCSSIQVYGQVDEKLLELAKGILELLPSRRRNNSEATLDARAFAALASAEIDGYRKLHPDLKARVQVRDDIVGLLVSRGNLMISSGIRLSPGRTRALLNHEIGTHVVTYANGRAQPFQQLYSGLAGYESLQEGVAVLSEYLVGELSASRLRLLAARVVAVRNMLDGMNFVENFHELTGRYNFNQRTAYGIILRTYRGGGLTKDAVYLRGLRDVFEYLQKGGDLEALYIGKVSLSHLPVLRELRWRKILKPPPLLPHFLNENEPRERLANIQKGLALLQIVKKMRRRQ